MSNHKTNNSRRDFLLKSMTLIPAAVIGGSGVGALTAPAPAVAAPNTSTQNDYQPTFFTPEEWAFIRAAVARLIPADERGPGALEAGVPEFIDRQMNTPYATGSIWYMQGPFNPDVPKEMGYQLPLVPKQIYNLGISDADAYSKKTAGKPFAELDGAQQDAMLQSSSPARRSSSSCRRNCSSPICCKTPAKVSSAILSMAATKTWWAGS